MYEEVNAAAIWWTNQLKLPAALLKSFHNALSDEMLNRFTGHWYEDDRLRGSAYRSVSYLRRMDGMLCRAAQSWCACGCLNLCINRGVCVCAAVSMIWKSSWHTLDTKSCLSIHVRPTPIIICFFR